MATSPKSRQQLVEEAFATTEMQAFARDYLVLLLDNWREVDKGIRRTLFIILSLLALFELIWRSAITEVSLGVVSLSDLSLAQKVLPAVITYFFYEWLSYDLNDIWYRQVYNAMFRKFYKPLYDANLETGLAPRTPNIFFGTELLQGRTRTVEGVLGILILFLVVGGIPIFDIFAFYRLIQRFGIADLVLWLSMFVTGVYVIRAVSLFVAEKGVPAD